MRKILVDNVIAGAKLAKSIFTLEGRILLPSGAELKGGYIEKLKVSGITEVFIEDELSEGIEIEDVICEQTRIEAKTLVKNMMDDYNLTKALNEASIKGVITKIIDELLDNKDILVSLADIKSVDDYTFGHSVNVCILSLVTGISMGMDGQQLNDLGVGSLLHDIGKLKIPEEILKKPSQLTVEEFNEIKKHTIYGYEILRDNEKISMVSALIALGHHERYDGSGYPMQIKALNINQCARIVAIADVYDALNSDRVYRKKLYTHQVVDYISAYNLNHFDKDIVNSFMRNVAVFPTGTGVLLNTKEKALIVRQNKGMPTRPVIRLVFDDKGQRFSTNNEIDLSQKMGISIQEACEI